MKIFLLLFKYCKVNKLRNKSEDRTVCYLRFPRGPNIKGRMGKYQGSQGGKGQGKNTGKRLHSSF